jgi:2-methylisocitrate lyase-like PEP mutase family enzyme
VPNVESLGRVINATSLPVNALAAGALAELSVTQMADLGVRRISVGSMIARMTHAATLDAMSSIVQAENFEAFESAADGDLVDRLLTEGSAP